MGSSIRGGMAARGGVSQAYVPDLERVCAGIERGHRFCIEPRPGTDLARSIGVELVRNVYLHILDGGDVIMRDLSGQKSFMLGMTLGNYNRLWRCWIGPPTPAKMLRARWRP